MPAELAVAGLPKRTAGFELPRVGHVLSARAAAAVAGGRAELDEILEARADVVRTTEGAQQLARGGPAAAAGHGGVMAAQQCQRKNARHHQANASRVAHVVVGGRPGAHHSGSGLPPEPVGEGLLLAGPLQYVKCQSEKFQNFSEHF